MRFLRPRRALCRASVVGVVLLAAAVLLVLASVPDAHAAVAAPSPSGPPQKMPKDLGVVIGNITSWLTGLLAGLATLFLTVGGVRYLLAGGDPSEVSRAKDTLKYSAIGYGLAALAPLILTILTQFVSPS